MAYGTALNLTMNAQLRMGNVVTENLLKDGKAVHKEMRGMTFRGENTPTTQKDKVYPSLRC